MKKRIAVRSEYFNKSQSKGLMSHIKRDFINDRNVINKDLTKHNFGSSDVNINSRYDAALKLMPESAKNTLIDSVLVLPLDQFKEVQRSHPETWRKELNSRIVSMMVEMSNETGFEAIGYKMHLDEGHFDGNGDIVLNPHAHLLFANICKKDIVLTKEKKVTLKDDQGKALKDPKKPSRYLYEKDDQGNIKTVTESINLKGRMPLSLHQTRGSKSIWSKQQDIAAKHLADLGFERGLSAELTQSKNKKKAQYVVGVLSKAQQELEAAELIKSQRYSEIEALEAQKNSIIDGIKSGIKEFLRHREALTKAVFDSNMNNAKLAAKQALSAFIVMNDHAKKEIVESTEQRYNDLKNTAGVDSSKELSKFGELVKSIKDQQTSDVIDNIIKAPGLIKPRL